ncbi:LamG domain-containing protein [Pseudomonas sp. NY15436]|uniref:LamG domain-containing protein n=1 Tax=Pseudomonas sp. NY15436 TaxID=3400359 RepID=UPI003A864703
MIPGIVAGQMISASGPATDPQWTLVSALLHFDGSFSSEITDQKGHTFTTFNGAAISTVEKKFGSASLLLNGSSNYINSATSSDWEFGSGDFTLEAWVRPAATITSRQEIFNRFNVAGWGVQILDTGFLRAFVANSTSGTVLIGPGSTAVTAGSWHHVALSRSGSTLRLFLDGVTQATAAISGAIETITNALFIGADSGTSRFFNGNIDELRITKGYARYTSNFTPPNSAFPNS